MSHAGDVSRRMRALGGVIDLNKFEVELLEPGVEPSMQDEVNKFANGRWRMQGALGLRHWVREKKEKGMTRSEAVKLVVDVTKADFGRVVDWREGLVNAVEALGLIAFEREKTEDEMRRDAMLAAWRAAGQTDATTGPEGMLEALEAAGFEIRRKA